MKLRRYKHNLGHYHLAACKMGELVPVSVMEVLPGDTFRHRASALVRVAPLVAPLMHPCQVQIHSFFVPNRIIWDGAKTGDDGSWEDFITGAATPTFPTVTPATAPDDTDLLDHMGVPPETGNATNALPVRAYNLIFNEYYRDQGVDSEVSLDSMALQKARWGKDYFTTCRTEEQQGTGALVPFSTGEAPVLGVGVDTSSPGWSALGNQTIDESDGGTSAQGYTAPAKVLDPDTSGGGDYPYVYADLAAASGGISINDLRQGLALQRIADARAKYGERYADYLRFYGVNPKDGRLSRPEYLGGGKQTISFSEVLATGASTGVDVGDLFGHGIAAIRTRAYKKFFEEHGHVITLMSVRPRTMYTEMVHKNWLRTSKNDYWHKELEVLPTVPVLKKEVYFPHGNLTDIFGYQDNFREYREHPSYVSGEFRNSTAYQWHFGRILGSSPSLNTSFLECTPATRVYADTAGVQLYNMIHHQVVAQRLVSNRPQGT